MSAGSAAVYKNPVPPAEPVRLGNSMPRILDKLWILLAAATDRELTRMVEYLKEENRILRSKLPERVPVTAREKQRLVRLGKPLGAAVKDLVTIVCPRTFQRWVKEADGPVPAKPVGDRKPGRPRTPVDVKELVLKLAKETGWGYTRILGELKKLGVTVSRSTVVNILKEAGLDPSPERKKGTWADFVKRHQATLWASDFAGVKSFTTSGIVDLFILFFIHIETRRVFVAGVTAAPNAEWVTQQARNVTMVAAEMNLGMSHLIIDHDSKYVAGFDAVLEADGVEVKRVGPRAPNLNAYAERWVQSLRSECLDMFMVVGERHLRLLCDQYVAHYNIERSHQGVGNVPLTPGPDPPTLPFPSTAAPAVVCHERLGGVLKHYTRAA
jgi:putative transposase